MGKTFSSKLHVACLGKNDAAVAKIFFETPEDMRSNKINVRDEGETPLSCACRGGHVPTIQFLLRHGADPQLRSEAGETLVHVAVSQGHSSVVEYLLAKVDGISADQQDSDGWSALHVASRRGALRSIELLLHHGAEINKPNCWGLTPFHLASREGEVATMKLLITQGADTQTKTKTGATALHWAASKGQLRAVRFLIARCSLSIAAQDDRGKTPRDMAAEHGHEDVQAYLDPSGKSSKLQADFRAAHRREAQKPASRGSVASPSHSPLSSFAAAAATSVGTSTMGFKPASTSGTHLSKGDQPQQRRLQSHSRVRVLRAIRDVRSSTSGSNELRIRN